jgi:hypothetical protein
MPEKSVRDMLVAKVDELIDMATRDLDEIRAVTDQLEPDRAHSCGTAIAMTVVLLDEIRLRAHARPIEEGGL